MRSPQTRRPSAAGGRATGDARLRILGRSERAEEARRACDFPGDQRVLRWFLTAWSSSAGRAPARGVISPNAPRALVLTAGWYVCGGQARGGDNAAASRPGGIASRRHRGGGESRATLEIPPLGPCCEPCPSRRPPCPALPPGTPWPAELASGSNRIDESPRRCRWSIRRGSNHRTNGPSIWRADAFQGGEPQPAGISTIDPSDRSTGSNPPANRG